LSYSIFGGLLVKKEVPLVIADSALVKDFATLFNKGGSTSNKDAEILNKRGSPGYMGTDIFNKGGSPFTRKLVYTAT
jgi:hypothetical protein